MIESQRAGIYASPSAGSDAAPEGFSRAMQQHLSHWLRERPAAEHIGARTRRMGGGGGSLSESSPRTKGGEKMGSPDPAGKTPSRFPSKSSRPRFLFSARNILKPETF
jgi:hypothetical protein